MQKNIWAVALIHGIYDAIIYSYRIWIAPGAVSLFHVSIGLKKIFGDWPVFDSWYINVIWGLLSSIPELAFAIVLLKKYRVEKGSK